MWQSVIAILGTLAGASVSAWFQQRGQRAERTAAATATHRRDTLDAVTDLVTALADHRKTMWLREDARLSGADWAGLRDASHATRAAVTAPAVRVAILLPTLATTAQTATDATYAMRNATNHAALATAREDAVSAAERLINDAGQLLAA